MLLDAYNDAVDELEAAVFRDDDAGIEYWGSRANAIWGLLSGHCVLL